jgi:tetratricopeptide (TPR) repeat protein
MASIDFEKWDADIDSAEANKQQLYDEMKAAAKASPDDVKYLWRLTKGALVLSDFEEKNKNKDKCKSFVHESLVHAKKAIEVDPKSFEAHKWYCASVGRIAPLVGTKERIQYGHEFKKHSDIAVAIEPNDMLMYHMYGRWCYEVAGLTWVEKKIAATFFDAPPESTYDDALEALMKADKLKHNYKSNQLWIAKVLIAQKKYKEAMVWIDEAIKLETVSEDDCVCQLELQELQKKYSKYRN